MTWSPPLPRDDTWGKRQKNVRLAIDYFTLAMEVNQLNFGGGNPATLTLSNNAMYREKPNWSCSVILSDSCWHSSRAVVAESASRVFVLPSMKVMGSIKGFLDLVAWWAYK